jgi:hypothetical protein
MSCPWQRFEEANGLHLPATLMGHFNGSTLTTHLIKQLFLTGCRLFS